MLGIEIPGAPHVSTEYPAEPTDVLAAVLADLASLPARADESESYFRLRSAG